MFKINEYNFITIWLWVNIWSDIVVLAEDSFPNISIILPFGIWFILVILSKFKLPVL